MHYQIGGTMFAWGEKVYFVTTDMSLVNFIVHNGLS